MQTESAEVIKHGKYPGDKNHSFNLSPNQSPLPKKKKNTLYQKTTKMEESKSKEKKTNHISEYAQALINAEGQIRLLKKRIKTPRKQQKSQEVIVIVYISNQNR